MIKKVKELLESGAITQEVADQLNNEWTTHTKVLNDEAKTLRTEKQQLSDQYEEVVKKSGDLESQVSTLDEKIKQAKQDGHNEVAKELEAERTSKQELHESFMNLEKTNSKLKIENGVQKALGDYDVLDSDVVSTYVKQNVIIGEDGKIGYKNTDESVVSLEDGIKSFFESKPTLLKAVGGSGSGANDNNNNGSGANTKLDFGGDSKERKGAIEKMIAEDN